MVAVVVFFVAVTFALPARAFLGTGSFFAAAVLEGAAFFAAAGFVTVALDLVLVTFAVAVFPDLGFAAMVLGLVAGLFCAQPLNQIFTISYDAVTSFVADDSTGLLLGESLTRPEGPRSISMSGSTTNTKLIIYPWEG